MGYSCVVIVDNGVVVVVVFNQVGYSWVYWPTFFHAHVVVVIVGVIIGAVVVVVVDNRRCNS